MVVVGTCTAEVFGVMLRSYRCGWPESEKESRYKFGYPRWGV